MENEFIEVTKKVFDIWLKVRPDAKHLRNYSPDLDWREAHITFISEDGKTTGFIRHSAMAGDMFYITKYSGFPAEVTAEEFEQIQKEKPS